MATTAFDIPVEVAVTQLLNDSSDNDSPDHSDNNGFLSQNGPPSSANTNGLTEGDYRVRETVRDSVAATVDLNTSGADAVQKQDGLDLSMRQPEVFLSGPSGYRFCTGCRSNKRIEDFVEGRKMCKRHKKAKYSDLPTPTVLSQRQLEERIRATITGEGPVKLEGAFSLLALPEQEKVALELLGPKVVIGEQDLSKIPEIKNPDDPAELMRRARARCRPFLNMLHDITGYLFTYKDCRSGRRLKYSQSLRYFCSQRGDQDEVKRRSAATAAQRRKAEEAQAKAVLDGLGIDANTDITTATIAAIVQAQAQQAANGYADDGNENPLAGLDGKLDLSAAMVAATATLNSTIPNGDLSTTPGQTATGSSLGANNASTASSPLRVSGDMMPYKGQGKGWRKGTGKPKLPANPNKKPRNVDPNKPKVTQRKMERYDCKGCLFVNIFHDDDTVTFSYTHNIKHPEYVDVVGNRKRGSRFAPLSVNLDAVMVDAVGDTEVKGEDAFERVENTCHLILELVKALRSSRGGGEEHAAQKLYESLDAARSCRVSIVEALEKGGRGKVYSALPPDKKPSKKRKAEDMAGGEDDDEEDLEDDDEDADGLGGDDDEDDNQSEFDQNDHEEMQPLELGVDLSIPPSKDGGVSQTQEEIDAQNINGVIAMYLKSASTAAQAGFNDEDSEGDRTWALDPNL